MDVEAEIDHLFRLPPEDFIAARNDLVKRLRGAGERDAVEGVKGLRRPTVPAWALNQLTAHDPEGVQALAEVQEALTRAQRRLLSGIKDGGLREATARRREVVARLTQVAEEVLRSSGRDPSPHRAALSATLETAAVDPEGGARLQRGRLERDLAPPSGFGDVGGLALIQSGVEDAAAAPREPPPAEQEPEHPAVPTEDAAQQREERQREVAALQREERQREVAALQREVTVARAAVETARRDLRERQAALEIDREATQEAQRRAEQSDLEAARLARRAELARRQADADRAAARLAEQEMATTQAAVDRQGQTLALAVGRLAEAERAADGPDQRAQAR